MDEPLRLEISVVREKFGQGLRDRVFAPKLLRFDELSPEALREIATILNGMADKFNPQDRYYSFQLNAKQ